MKKEFFNKMFALTLISAITAGCATDGKIPSLSEVFNKNDKSTNDTSSGGSGNNNIKQNESQNDLNVKQNYQVGTPYVFKDVNTLLNNCPAYKNGNDPYFFTLHKSKLAKDRALSVALVCSPDNKTWASVTSVIELSPRYATSFSPYYKSSIRSAGGFATMKMASISGTGPREKIRNPSKSLQKGDISKSFVRAVVPNVFKWQDGSPVTVTQLLFMSIAGVSSESSLVSSKLDEFYLSLERYQVQELSKIPDATANQFDELKRLVDRARNDSEAAITRQASRPEATFERVSAYIDGLRNKNVEEDVPTFEQTYEGLGKFSPLNEKKACSVAIYETISKLQRDDKTRSIHKEGNSSNYYKDRNRDLFFAKNIREYNNQKADINFTDFVAGRDTGTVKVDIAHNEKCTTAYVIYRSVYASSDKMGNDNRVKQYDLSLARIDSDFLKNPDIGRVSRQYYRTTFAGGYGWLADFNYVCDEDTCKIK